MNPSGDVLSLPFYLVKPFRVDLAPLGAEYL
jgi:hypothetical protein